jgi:hypothetical protein
VGKLERFDKLKYQINLVSQSDWNATREKGSEPPLEFYNFLGFFSERLR